MHKVDSTKWAQAWSAPGAINGLEQPGAPAGAGDALSRATDPVTALSPLAPAQAWSEATVGLPSRAAARAAGPCSGAHTLSFAPWCPGSDLESLSARAAAAPGPWHCPGHSWGWGCSGQPGAPQLPKLLEHSSSKEELQMGKCLTLLLSGDFQKCLPQLPGMNHHFFCSCIFFSRKMNQCYPSQVSSCAETWQMCGNYLESCTGHRVVVACTWDRAMESLWMSPVCSWCPRKFLCVVQ